MNFAEEIKNRISAREVCEQYLIPVNRAGFACCIVHNEKTPSMKVYGENRGWHCFGCGANGDVISLVQKIFNIDFKTAIRKLNDDFSLGLPLDRKITQSEALKIAKENYERKKAIEERKQKKQEAEQRYWEAYDEWLKWEIQKDKTRPLTIDEGFNLLFVQALYKLPYAKYKLECAEMELARYEY